MIYARFNGVDYKLEERPVLSFSASETTFSEIVIDFTGKTAADLPIKYQEIQVVDTGTPDTVLYYGYCSQPSLPAFDGTQQRILLTIELLSPQTYLTKRTTTISIQNENIHDALEDILDDIVTKDGFTIALNNMPTDEYLSDIFNYQTIESILTNLSGRFGFVWHVDELKNIYIKDLDTLQTQLPVYSLTSPTASSLKWVHPYFNVADYANKVNFTNVTYMSADNVWPDATDFPGNTIVKFDYPFTISPLKVFRVQPDTDFVGIFTHIDDGSLPRVISATKSTKTITIDSEIGFIGEDDADPSKVILLERDSENEYVITGMKWVGSTQINSMIQSETTLRDAVVTYYDPVEIANNAGKLNTSGIVEKEVDVNGKYFTYGELTRYAKNFLRRNNKQADVVDICFRGDDLSTLKSTLKLSETVYIDLQNQFITPNNYIITNIEFVADSGKQELTVSTKRSNLTENFVDIFRKEVEERDELAPTQITSIYAQDETAVVNNQIIIDGEEVNV